MNVGFSKLVTQAKTLLSRAKSGLDERSHKCPTCGLTVYENRAEYQMRVEMEAMLRKLERFTTENGKESH